MGRNSRSGYLPIDENERKSSILKFEQAAQRQEGSAHIFIETPYRNDKLVEELCRLCKPSTKLCIRFRHHGR